ncbi:MAG: SOS-response repressor and protease LexA, partial [uncultured Gemmatimonadaceae bacterium]
DRTPDAGRAPRLPLPARLPEREHLPAEHPRDRTAVPHQEHEDGVRPPPVARREGLHRARPVALARRPAGGVQGARGHAARPVLREDPRGRAGAPPRAPRRPHHDGPPLRAQRADVLPEDPGRQHDRARDQRRRLRDDRPRAGRGRRRSDRGPAGRGGDRQDAHPPRRHDRARARQPQRARDRRRPRRRLLGPGRRVGDLPPLLRRARARAHERDGGGGGRRGRGRGSRAAL